MRATKGKHKRVGSVESSHPVFVNIPAEAAAPFAGPFGALCVCYKHFASPRMRFFFFFLSMRGKLTPLHYFCALWQPFHAFGAGAPRLTTRTGPPGCSAHTVLNGSTCTCATGAGLHNFRFSFDIARLIVPRCVRAAGAHVLWKMSWRVVTRFVHRFSFSAESESNFCCSRERVFVFWCSVRDTSVKRTSRSCTFACIASTW